MSPLVLASGSVSRQRMLTASGVPFRISPANLDEAGLVAGLLKAGAEPPEIAAVLAAEKALAVSRRVPEALVLGGDSVLALEREIISKCESLAALKALLLRLSGRTHLLISAASLAQGGREIWRYTGTARLTMRGLSETFLDAYLAAEGEVLLSSVGGYHYEGRGAQLFEAVEGDAFTIMGLPLLPVLTALREQGILLS
jgi:septum formation protein